MTMADTWLEPQPAMNVTSTTDSVEWSLEYVRMIWNGVELHLSVNVS